MDIALHLQEKFPHLPLTRNFSFARHTTIGCGGTAAAAASPVCAEDAAALFAYLEGARIPYCILGAGANVLPSDGMFEGVVVRTERLQALYAVGDAVYAGAGVTGGRLLRFAAAHCIGGFEPFSGIPMTVGGGVVMNAGVRELHFSDVTAEAVAVCGGILRTFRGAACGFGEKESRFQWEGAVVGVVLRGKRSDGRTIAARACEFRRRRADLPKGRSMGCAFVNPPAGSAGALIEACGLKGTRIGGAYVSETHANFLMNDGGSAGDVAELAALVRARVEMQTGVRLREEFRRLPDRT